MSGIKLQDDDLEVIIGGIQLTDEEFSLMRSATSFADVARIFRQRGMEIAQNNPNNSTENRLDNEFATNLSESQAFSAFRNRRL